MQKKCLIIIIGLAMMMPFISGGISTGVNGSIGIDLNSPELIYGMDNINNSQYFQGYTPSTLYDYYQTMLESYFDNVYCKISGCNMTGNLNVDGNVNATGNITADYFIGDGSQLTGIQTEETNFETYLNGSAYTNITYNLTAGDVNNVERIIEPGKQFIFGGTFE